MCKLKLITCTLGQVTIIVVSVSGCTAKILLVFGDYAFVARGEIFSPVLLADFFFSGKTIFLLNSRKVIYFTCLLEF